MKVALRVRALMAATALVSCSVSFDVGPRQDAGPLGGADGGTKSCVSVHADFCADFENGPVESGWDDKNETNGGSVGLDSTRSVESLRSAVFRSASEHDGTRASYATLTKAFAGTRSCTVEFDTWVTTPSWAQGPNFGLASVTIGPSGGPSAYFTVVIEPGDVTLAAQTPQFASSRWQNVFPYDHWVHVALDVDWNEHSASVRIDGTRIVEQTFSPSTAVGVDPKTSVQVGIAAFNPPAPTVAVGVDNVIVTLR